MEEFEEARRTVQEIQQEIDEFSPELFLVADPQDDRVTGRKAAYAICQHVFDEEWASGRVLADSMVGHAVSQQGMETLKAWSGKMAHGAISPDDVRYVPIEIIVDALLPLVVGEILHRFPVCCSCCFISCIVYNFF